MAITWQNVQGRDSAAILSGINQSGANLGESFRDLGALVGQEGDRRDTGRLNNLMAKLQSFKTPEEAEAFGQTPEGQEMMAGLTNEENRAQFQTALAARPGAIRQDITQRQEFDTAQTDFTQKATVEQLKAHQLAGIDPNVAQMIMAEGGLANQAALTEFGVAQDTRRTSAQAAKDLVIEDARKFGIDSKNRALQTSIQDKEQKGKHVDRTGDMYTSAQAAQSAVVESVLGSKSGVVAAMAGLKGTVPEEDVEEVAAIVGKIVIALPGGQYIPTGFLQDTIAAGASEINNFWALDSTSIDYITDKLTAYVADNPDAAKIQQARLADSRLLVESAQSDYEQAQAAYGGANRAALIKAGQVERDRKNKTAAPGSTANEKTLDAAAEPYDPLKPWESIAPDSKTSTSGKKTPVAKSETVQGYELEAQIFRLDSSQEMSADAQAYFAKEHRNNILKSLKPIGDAVANIADITSGASTKARQLEQLKTLKATLDKRLKASGAAGPGKTASGNIK